MASSLVGVRIRAWIALPRRSIFSRMGRPKAAVFPVPVWACPMISRSPFKRRGMTFC